jgi:hypothetical protein
VHNLEELARALSVLAASVSGIPERLHICGVPGTGKSYFIAWLVKHHGFTPLIADETPTARQLLQRGAVLTIAKRKFGGEPSVHELRNAAQAGGTARLRSLARGLGRRVVLETGFAAGNHETTAIQTFRAAGFDAWWFDAARIDALRSFLKKGGHQDSFEQTWKVIESSRPEIEARYPHRTITVLHGETYMQPRDIAAVIVKANHQPRKS